MAVKNVLLLFVLSAFFLGSASSGKVLVWPADDSHWINLKVILEELTARGHQVTVLLPSFFQIPDPTEPSPFELEVISVPITREDVETEKQEFLKLWIYGTRELSLWKLFTKASELGMNFLQNSRIICEQIMLDEKLLRKLESTGFDVLVSDPLTQCGELVAEKLQIPLVHTVRFTMGNTIERICGGMPAPPSYVPGSGIELTDRMSFTERTKNMLFYLLNDVMFHQFLVRNWNKLYSDVLGRPTTACELLGKADIWLVRTYWDFDFPRPFLPNFEFVGGLHCRPAKPLPEEMEEFVQSSGEDGIVVFSLGSIIKNLTDEKANMFALALSQLPQKVIWRYKGRSPEALGANTRIYDWIPQNDLLGHPKTKAFISHGGANGIYEAIYHGIPMVGIPLFAEQPGNMVHMTAKGMAVRLDIHTMKTEDIVNAVNTVIHDPRYKESAVRLSRIQHDQPTKPLERAVFWIEYVMRHKGAPHLRVAAHHLAWYQYHCLDVIAFLVSCTAAFVFVTVKCCSFCCRKCGRAARKRKAE